MSASGTGIVAHHFDNLRQQQSTVRLGMWLFLVTEVLFFGGVFCAYTGYRIWFPKEFEAGSAALNVGIATVNTFLLLTSSLTITLGIRSAHMGDVRGLKAYLMLTIILGTAFLALKGREYQLDYQEGLLPGTTTLSAGAKSHEAAHSHSDAPHEPVFVRNVKVVLHEQGYKVEGVDLARVQLFFMFYYIMTGLHVIHMIVGVGLLVWQYVLAMRGFFDHSERYVYVEVMSLYWHFVDMVWIFLMPLLYLAGPHTFAQVGEGLRIAFGSH